MAAAKAPTVGKAEPEGVAGGAAVGVDAGEAVDAAAVQAGAVDAVAVQRPCRPDEGWALLPCPYVT